MLEETCRFIVDQSDPPLPAEVAAALLEFGRWMQRDGFMLVGHQVDGDHLLVTFASERRFLRVPVVEMPGLAADLADGRPVAWDRFVVPEGVRP